MLYGWMKSLIIYLILSGLVMNLAPGKNYKRYINFFTGLIVIIILAEPLAYIFHLSSGDLSGFAQSIGDYMEQNNTVREHDTIYDYYEMSLGESMCHELRKKGYPAESAEIVMDGERRVLRCTIILESGAGAFDSAVQSDETISGMKNYISDVYNVERDSIYIVRR